MFILDSSCWYLLFLSIGNRRDRMAQPIGPHDVASLPVIPSSGTLPQKGDRQHAFWERNLVPKRHRNQLIGLTSHLQPIPTNHQLVLFEDVFSANCCLIVGWSFSFGFSWGQVHATAMLLVAKGHLKVDEVRRGIEYLDPKTYAEASYYEKRLAKRPLS